jgi:hypothetical protein
VCQFQEEPIHDYHMFLFKGASPSCHIMLTWQFAIVHHFAMTNHWCGYPLRQPVGSTLTLEGCMAVDIRIHATADHGTSQPDWQADACDCLQTGQRSYCGTPLRLSGILRSTCMPCALWTAGMGGYRPSAALGGFCWRCCRHGLRVEGDLQGVHSPFQDMHRPRLASEACLLHLLDHHEVGINLKNCARFCNKPLSMHGL